MGGFGFVIAIENLSVIIFFNISYSFSIVTKKYYISKIKNKIIRKFPFFTSKFLYKYTIKYIIKLYNKILKSSFFFITMFYMDLFTNLIKQHWKNPLLYYCLNMTYIAINVLFILIFKFIILTHPLSLFASMDLFNNNSDCFINYAYLAIDFNYISFNFFWIIETDIFINFLSSFEHNFEYSIDFSLNYNNDLKDRMIDYSNPSGSNFNGDNFNLPGPDSNGTNPPQSNWGGGNSPQPDVDDLIRALNSDLLNKDSNTVTPMEVDDSTKVKKDVTKDFLMSEQDNDTYNIRTMFTTGIEALKDNVLTRPIKQRTLASSFAQNSWISSFFQLFPQYNIGESTGVLSFYNGYTTDKLEILNVTHLDLRELASNIISKLNGGLPTHYNFTFCRTFQGAYYDLNHTFDPNTIYPWFHPYHTKMVLTSLENNTTHIIINIILNDNLSEDLSCVYPVEADDYIDYNKLSIEYKYLSLHEIDRVVNWWNVAQRANWYQIRI